MNPADIVEVEPGVYSVLLDGVSYEARVSGTAIEVGGHTIEIAMDDPRQWKGASAAAAQQGRAALRASMPGKVVRLLVQAGDMVEAGQGILVLEAMKMQNELKSPRAGRVTSLNVAVNDSVVAGALLAAIGEAG